jgi:hypothetical protein
MPENPRLEQEPSSWMLYVLECKAIDRLRDDYGWKPEDIEHIRTHGAVAIPCDNPQSGRRMDYSIPWGESGFWLVRPDTAEEEQCLEYLVKIRQIRDAIAAGDVWAATALCWQFGHDSAVFTIETLYGETVRMGRKQRDEMLIAQIQEWLRENPRIKNAEMARRLRNDPKYAPMTAGIQALPKFVSRLRAERDKK